MNNSDQQCQPFGSICASYKFNKKRTKYDHSSKSRQAPCIRPYHVENTSSRPITEVKQHWAALVLGWVTAWEYAVLYTFFLCKTKHLKKADEAVYCSHHPILDSLVVRIPACHAGGRGSIPRQGELFFIHNQKGTFKVLTCGLRTHSCPGSSVGRALGF